MEAIKQAGFSFTNLAKELGHLSKIDGLAVMPASMGVYDMWGSPIEVNEEDLPLYIENTQRVLNTTKDSKGKIVGLPIDLQDHDHLGGAGWIVAIELSDSGKVIRFEVEWTSEGIEAIADNTSRYFSPTFNQEGKLILGGSLTNWPGSRDGKGKYLLSPVELSQSKSLNVVKKEKDMTVETVPEVKPSWLASLETKLTELQAAFGSKKPDPKQQPTISELSNATITELLNTPEALAEMGRQAEAKATERAEAYKRQMHVVELASQLVGGTTERPLGIAVKSDEIVELLLSLPLRQSLAVEKLLCKFMDSVVDYRELGTSGGGFVKKPRVPAEYRAALQTWVNSGLELSGWFSKVGDSLGLDKAENYNLTEFVKEA